MYQNIEPITGTNLADVSTDNLEQELKFYQNYLNTTENKNNINTIIKHIEKELLIRSNKIKCEFLSSCGKCKNDLVLNFNNDPDCSLVESEQCLKIQYEALMSF